MGIPAQSTDMRRYEVQAKIGDGAASRTITTQLRIEAAGTITLTQSEKDAGRPGQLYVPPTAHLTVLGDEVIIDGRLSFPGRVVNIVARRIEGRSSDGSTGGPAIIVDGAELDRAIREPKELPKGVTPERLAPLQKVAKGRKGADATNDVVHPKAGAEMGGVWGTTGWSAEDHPREMHGEHGEDGVAGNPGGNIVLICRDLAVTGGPTQLILSARGGQGGDGQKGQDGADGGDGGEPFDAQDGVGFMSAGFKFAVPGGEGGKGGDGGNGGRAGAGGNGGSIIVYTDRPITPVGITASVEAGPEGQPGKLGKYGEGGRGARAATGIEWRRVPGQLERRGGKPGWPGHEGGKPSKQGVPGKVEIKQGKAGEVLGRAVSVAQLAMMTDRVRSSYLSLDPEADESARTDVLDRMEWLSRLLEGIPPQHPHYPLARAVVLEVQYAKDAIKRGMDWFGNAPGYVPSVSVGRLSQDVTQQLKVLGNLEELNGTYANALIEHQNTTKSIQDALSVGDNQLAAVAQEFTTTRDKLEKTATDIKVADDKRKAARESLEKALVNFNVAVLKNFGLSAETLFNALSQLSFTSPHSPAGAALMGVSQVGTVLNEGMKNILDDTGRPVEKGYLLGEVKRLSSSDLSVDLRQYADGRFADEPTYRAIIEYDKVKQRIQNFSNNTQGTARAAVDRINEFIDLVIERNRLVDYYNRLLQDLVDLNTQERRLRLRQQISRDRLSRADPSLDEVTDFFSALYETAKQDCIKALYLLYRAQSFWSLEPLNGFHHLLGASPIGLRHALLNAAAGRLSSMLTGSFERIRRTPNRFPTKDEAVGVPVVLTREKHKFIFDDLELLGSAEFRIAPATRRSPPTKMWEPTVAVSNCDTWLDPTGPNPFHGRADVRLTKIRVWLVGFETSSPLHTVRIDHLGSELFCTSGNALYPQYRQNSAGGASGEPGRVYHTGLQLPFIYSPDGLQRPEAPGGFHPGKLDVDGAQDGDLNFSANVGLGLGMQDCYAAVGPFADWRLVVDDQNTDASWGKLHTIVIDFHGFHQTF